MKISILLATLCLFLSNAYAQNTGNISGTISKNSKPYEGATISLLRSKDSSTVKISASNKEGQYVFENIFFGKYIVLATAVSHQKTFSQVIEINAQQPVAQAPAITMVPVNKDLAAVTVTAKRPLIEQRIDRTIINVDASITNVGTNALEVLEKSPGVSVDRDGNISLKGKDGVLILVDGRPTQLSQADLANLLRNMHSSQLDQIEIMTNPPARYDAAGNAGIINIKTKKIIKAGINGSANLGYTQGKYPKTNEAFNFNYREGKINLFTNLSHNYQKRYQTLYIDRNIYNGSTIDRIFNQETNRLGKGNSYSAKVGIDFFATKKTTVGAVVNLNKSGMTASNPSIINISNPSGDLESVTTALVNKATEWNSNNINLNFRSVLDKKGTEITSDVDYAKHTMNNDLFMENSYTDAGGNAYIKADT
ncbi:MAG: TonB-dependent receptor plug domain-containing protein, partial [Flavisolibacter sp.]